MIINQKAVEEFKEIYYQEYGVKLSTRKATRKAVYLLMLFEVLVKKQPNLINA